MVKPKEPKVVTIMGLPTRRFVRITRSEKFKTLFHIVYAQPSSLGTQYKTFKVHAEDELDALCKFQAWCVQTARQYALPYIRG